MNLKSTYENVFNIIHQRATQTSNGNSKIHRHSLEWFKLDMTENIKLIFKKCNSCGSHHC